MKVISHEVYPERGIEEMIVEDDHGRKAHFQCSILNGPDPDKFFADQMAEFELQERKLSRHVKDFKPKTSK